MRETGKSGGELAKGRCTTDAIPCRGLEKNKNSRGSSSSSSIDVIAAAVGNTFTLSDASLIVAAGLSSIMVTFFRALLRSL